MYNKDELAAIGKMLKGEEPIFSTGICGSITCGYGELSDSGYWQYPLSFEFWTEKHQEIEKLYPVYMWRDYE